jgi:preprotein translocase subunit SecG
MLANILMIFQIIVCVALVGFVLMQQSEGGALGMGGSPSGFMSARGAGDLLTRITWILFAIFLTISVGMTWLTAREQANSSVLDRVKSLDLNQTLPTGPAKPVIPPAGSLAAPDLAPPATPAPALPSSLGGAPANPLDAPATTPPAPASQPKQ